MCNGSIEGHLDLKDADGLPPLTPFDPATMIQSLDEQGRGLRVVFFRPPSATDRWGHVVATVVGDGEAEETVVPRLISQEGSDPDGWPLSPPLQSLAIENRPEGAVALLVGMSGQSHWSASFEALADRRLKIDIACRLGSGVKEWRLGSTYAGHSQGDVRLDIGPDIVMETTLSGRILLAVENTAARPVRWKYELQYCG